MFRPPDGIGAQGVRVPGPPWILGARGAPLEAPENTLASLRRAMELGLDGVAYELRACASGEAFLLADERLDRTSDREGRLAERTLPELAGLDAGSWFDGRFAGEPLAMLEEALALEGNHAGSFPQHWIELRSDELVGAVARALEGFGKRSSVRVASRRRDVCLELRDAGLVPALVVDELDRDLAGFLRDERIAACALLRGDWPGPAGEAWPCERWSLGVDEPARLVAACRGALNGFTTREPLRAHAARALAFLAPEDERGWPLQVPGLPVEPGSRLEGPGEWAGAWSPTARVRNPFGFDVAVAVDLVVRRGAFEAHGLPARARLAPGEELEVPFELTGGSWSPGGDPLLFAHFAWQQGPGRPGERLVFDAPLERVRALHLGRDVLRVALLRERPEDPQASMTLRRKGASLLVAVESPGDLEDPIALVQLDGREHRGGAGVRVPLPDDFDARAEGVPFSLGFLGRTTAGGRAGVRLRRWAGGLPFEGDHGAPGRLLSGTRA